MKGQSPPELILDQSSLRKHLKTAIQNANITDFPHISKTYNNYMLNMYFNDQKQKQNKEEVYSEVGSVKGIKSTPTQRNIGKHRECGQNYL